MIDLTSLEAYKNKNIEQVELKNDVLTFTYLKKILFFKKYNEISFYSLENISSLNIKDLVNGSFINYSLKKNVLTLELKDNKNFTYKVSFKINDVKVK